jgi:hypothetical protein
VKAPDGARRTTAHKEKDHGEEDFEEGNEDRIEESVDDAPADQGSLSRADSDLSAGIQRETGLSEFREPLPSGWRLFLLLCGKVGDLAR